MAADLLHVIDPARPPERLWQVVAEQGVTLATALDHPVLRWRAARQIRAARPRAVVAWAPRALRVALQAGFGPIVYRPPLGLPPLAARRGVILLCRGEAELQRTLAAGWPAEQVGLLPDPIPPTPSLAREDVGFPEADFLWLLPGDGDRLWPAVWAGALMHVLQRHSGRQHRLVVPGDGPGARQAKRFIDQLGLPEMTTPVTTWDFATLAPLADAALLAPEGQVDPWHARIVRACGLPVVITPAAKVCGELRDYAWLWQAASGKPREMTRVMNELVEAKSVRSQGACPAPPDVEQARAAFRQLLD